MRHAIIEHGEVIRISQVLSHETPEHGAVPCDVEVVPGWLWDGATFRHPGPRMTTYEPVSAPPDVVAVAAPRPIEPASAPAADIAQLRRELAQDIGAGFQAVLQTVQEANDRLQQDNDDLRRRVAALEPLSPHVPALQLAGEQMRAQAEAAG